MRSILPLVCLATLLAGAAGAQPYAGPLRDLDRAQRNLAEAIDATERARGGLGGHRNRAIDLMRQAQRELNEAARRVR